MKTKITAPISGKDIAQCVAQAKAAAAGGAQIIELRTDYLDDLSVESVAELIAKIRSVAPNIPLLVTCRDKAEGGAKDYPLDLRLSVLCQAAQCGADFIDIEFANFKRPEVRQKIQDALAGTPTRLILSAHQFEGCFADIDTLYDQMKGAWPQAIVKIVYTAKHINDCFEAFDLLNRTQGQDRIILAMTEAGQIVRILCAKFGAMLTFARIDESSGTAPGQVTIEQLKELYRFEHIDQNTEVYGIIGSPVAHSSSPAYHNTGFTRAGLNKVYLPLLIDGGRDGFFGFIDHVRRRPWLGFAGFSVTIPHKQNAIEYAKSQGGEIEPLAEKIGAANTMTLNKERIRVFNTDYAGAMDAIIEKLGDKTKLNGLNTAVIGAGGVSRAIVAGLVDAGATVTIYNRTFEKAERLAREFDGVAKSLSEVASLDAELIVNCTNIGMHPDVDQSPLPKACLKKGLIVFDTVYNPAETLLLKNAEAAGSQTISGVDMFNNQAAKQFALFTNKNT